MERSDARKRRYAMVPSEACECSDVRKARQQREGHDSHPDPTVARLIDEARAQALYEAAEECLAKSRLIREAYREHNAGRGPGRPIVRPDLIAWANAEEACGYRLNNRALGLDVEADRDGHGECNGAAHVDEEAGQ